MKKQFSGIYLLVMGLLLSNTQGQTPQLPMGMNIDGASYWSPSPYNDPFKTAGEFFTYSGSSWSTNLQDQLPFDDNGYPLEVPFTVEGVAQNIRSMVNTCRGGEYVFMWDGDGDVSFHGALSAIQNGSQIIVTANGSCDHGWIQINRSNPSDHLRNFRLIPLEYSADPESAPLFDANFLDGLRPFHALRFMDWMHTNGSFQNKWEDRALPTDYSFGVGKGMPIEHAIELSNLLGTEAWFCVPANADDEYIQQFAILVRDQLNPLLKAYVEYSNEVWNWGFSQAHFVGRNGLEISWEGDTLQVAADTIQAGLAQVGIDYCGDASSYCHPEKDAYMMDRTFKIWKAVYGSEATTRLVRVATAQHAWYDNTGRVLNYLFTDGDGADAISVAGYFNFEEDDHNAWNAMDPASVTPDMIIDSVFNGYEETSGLWTRESAKYARQYDIDYMVYEGGQHMQPYLQGDYAYNQSVWDAQIHPRMYDLYLKNFEVHVEDTVDCKLFMAFSYAGNRESRYGSWGHLENFAQAQLSGAALKLAAPKYAALLDANTPKTEVPVAIPVQSLHYRGSATNRMIVKNNQMIIQINKPSGIQEFDLRGNRIP
jgi:hypothetical protein